MGQSDEDTESRTISLDPLAFEENFHKNQVHENSQVKRDEMLLASVANAERDVFDLKTALYETNETMQELNEETVILRRIRQVSIRENLFLETELKCLQSEHEALQIERGNMQRECDAFDEDRSTLLKERVEMQAKNEILNIERDGLQAERDDLLKKIDTLQATHDLRDKQLAGMQVLLDAFTTEQRSLASTICKHETTIYEAQDASMGELYIQQTRQLLEESMPKSMRGIEPSVSQLALRNRPQSLKSQDESSVSKGEPSKSKVVSASHLEPRRSPQSLKALDKSSIPKGMLSKSKVISASHPEPRRSPQSLKALDKSSIPRGMPSESRVTNNLSAVPPKQDATNEVRKATRGPGEILKGRQQPSALPIKGQKFTSSKTLPTFQKAEQRLSAIIEHPPLQAAVPNLTIQKEPSIAPRLTSKNESPTLQSPDPKPKAKGGISALELTAQRFRSKMKGAKPPRSDSTSRFD